MCCNESIDDEPVYTDMRNVPINIGDVIAYGKSDRNNPINIGTVVGITVQVFQVLGAGNVKVGKVPVSHSKRIIVLPDDYLEC